MDSIRPDATDTTGTRKPAEPAESVPQTLLEAVREALEAPSRSCNCGYGGFHEPLNRRCDLYGFESAAEERVLAALEAPVRDLVRRLAEVTTTHAYSPCFAQGEPCGAECSTCDNGYSSYDAEEHLAHVEAVTRTLIDDFLTGGIAS